MDPYETWDGSIATAPLLATFKSTLVPALAVLIRFPLLERVPFGDNPPIMTLFFEPVSISAFLANF
jgi:hypothetical protein